MLVAREYSVQSIGEQWNAGSSVRAFRVADDDVRQTILLEKGDFKAQKV